MFAWRHRTSSGDQVRVVLWCFQTHCWQTTKQQMHGVCFRALSAQEEAPESMHRSETMLVWRLLLRSFTCCTVDLYRLSKRAHIPIVESKLCNQMPNPADVQSERPSLLCQNAVRDQSSLFQLSCNHIPRRNKPSNYCVQKPAVLPTRAAHHSLFRRKSANVFCMRQSLLPNKETASGQLLQLASHLQCWYRLRDFHHRGPYMRRLQPCSQQVPGR